MTSLERQLFSEELAALDEADDSIRQAMKPFYDALLAVETLRDNLLTKHEAEVAGHCDGCAALILTGERGHRCADGEVLCFACAPTWRDLKNQWRKSTTDDDGGVIDEALAGLAAAEAHVKGGGALADKHVWPL